MLSLRCLNEEKLKSLAKLVGEELDEIKAVLLVGDLGSGKTTFVKGFVTSFNLKECIVKSPTFSILNIYKGSKVIYHLDLYRIEQQDHELLMEIEEALEQENSILIVEWADRLKKFWPRDFLRIHLDFCGDARNVTIECQDKKVLDKIASRWFGEQEIRKT